MYRLENAILHFHCYVYKMTDSLAVNNSNAEKFLCQNKKFVVLLKEDCRYNQTKMHCNVEDELHHNSLTNLIVF